MAKSGIILHKNTIIGMDLGFEGEFGAWIMGEILPNGVLEVIKMGKVPPEDKPGAVEELADRMGWARRFLQEDVEKAQEAQEAQAESGVFQREYVTSDTEDT